MVFSFNERVKSGRFAGFAGAFLLAAVSCVLLVACVLLMACGDADDGPVAKPDEPVKAKSSEAVEAVVASGGESAEASSSLPEVPIEPPRAKWKRMDDPEAEGWGSEVLANAAAAQLDKLGVLFFEEGNVEPLLAPKFNVDPLVPKNLEKEFEDNVALVERAVLGDGEAQHGNVKDLKAELSSLRAQSKGGKGERHFKFKIVRVAREDTWPEDQFATEVLFSLAFPGVESIVEHHATWTVVWRGEAEGQGAGEPKIEGIRVIEFARTTTKRPTRLFSDCTESALAANECYGQQLAYGMNHWLSRLPVRAMLNRFGTPGLAIGDVNNDGLDDFYLCQEPGLPNRLFLQNPDGTAKEAAAAWGVDWIEDSRSALLIDLDNDGDQDLAVAIRGHVVIARNNDGKRFEVIGALPASDSTASMGAADYDGDGRIDIYVCGYVQEGGGASMGAAGTGRFVYHDAENGAANFLFRNESAGSGALAFTDVTEATGLNANNSRWSFAASWEDFDNDGDQDLYVANDYGRNNLFRNDGGRFVDIAASAEVEDSASGMSVAWGDYNRDGRMDVYVSNMFSAAGSRITAQKKFKQGTDESLRSRFRRFARGNTLFKNTGDAPFEDVSLSAGVELGRWAWSSNFVDLNNDAWLDLVVANGYLSSDGDTGDL